MNTRFFINREPAFDHHSENEALIDLIRNCWFCIFKYWNLSFIFKVTSYMYMNVYESYSLIELDEKTRCRIPDWNFQYFENSAEIKFIGILEKLKCRLATSKISKQLGCPIPMIFFSGKINQKSSNHKSFFKFKFMAWFYKSNQIDQNVIY